MTTIADRAPVEPLFANRGRLWLRIWALTQGVAISIALYALLDGANGPKYPGMPGPAFGWSILAALIAYHVAGFVGYGWLLGHRWATAIYVPLGWFLIIASLRVNGAFALLVLGAIIQGFVFLPFAWAIGTLSVVTALLLWSIGMQDHWRFSSLALARMAGILASGVMVATVMLYIDRANRDAVIRSRLLRELEDAQRDLAERARQAGVQEERQRLARDIHDTLAQGFTSVIKHLEAIDLSMPNDDREQTPATADIRRHLGHAQEVSRESLSEIRRLVWALRPAALEESTLPAAVQRIVTQWSASNGVAASCDIEPLPGLNPDAEVIFLRTVQEALSNVARHADAQRVVVSLGSVDGLVMLSIEDDGRGFDAEASAGGGRGIAGMRERVRPFGGRVMIESERDAGTSITVALPVDAIVVAP